jgi:hypothetical protein
VHAPTPRARFGLLVAAAALIAVFVAAPNAGAATFGGGSIKLDFKQLKGVKITPKGHSVKTKTGATFPFSEDAGSATMNAQASGNLNLGATSEVTITRGKKKIVLKSFVEKLKTGTGTLAAKVGGKGKLIDFFSQASANRIVVDNGFTTLSMQTANMSLTKTGAAALNKAFGLKGKSSLKNKAKLGTSSFTANRSLIVAGGASQTVYDTAFYDQLKSCDITLGSVPDATPIAEDPNAAPRGGVSLPIKGGSTINAVTLFGKVDHSGGTVLTRPAPGQPGNSTGKAGYNSELNDFTFDFSEGQQILSSFVKNLNLRSPTGTVTGTLVPQLNEGGGTVSLSGDLVLSDAAALLLSSKDPPIGADCPIPAGSKIGRVSMSANVN